MKKKQFNFGWLEKRRFHAERKRQEIEKSSRYQITGKENVESYWRITGDIPSEDIEQEKVLSSFAQKLALKK